MAWRASVVRVRCPRRTRKQQRRRVASGRPCPSVWTCPAARGAWRGVVARFRGVSGRFACPAVPLSVRVSVVPYKRHFRRACGRVAAWCKTAAALCRGAWHFAYTDNDGGGRVRRCRVPCPFLNRRRGGVSSTGVRCYVSTWTATRRTNGGARGVVRCQLSDCHRALICAVPRVERGARGAVSHNGKRTDTRGGVSFVPTFEDGARRRPLRRPLRRPRRRRRPHFRRRRHSTRTRPRVRPS